MVVVGRLAEAAVVEAVVAAVAGLLWLCYGDRGGNGPVVGI